MTMLWKRKKTVGSCQKACGNRKIVKKYEAELKKTEYDNKHEGFVNEEEENGKDEEEKDDK